MGDLALTSALVPCSADDNAKFASCGRDRAVFVWDVPTGSVIRKFEGHDHVRALAVLTVGLSAGFSLV